MLIHIFRKKNNVLQFINVSVFCCSPLACTKSMYGMYNACVMNLRPSFSIQKTYNKKPAFLIKNKMYN